MAKNLALLALILGVASLFLPTTQGLGGAVTVGVLTGTEKNPAGAMLMGPPVFAALFGATLGRRRFGRGLGTLHLLFGLIGLALCSIIFGDERVGSGPMDVQIGMGAYCAAASGLLVFIAGIIGLVKPDPKV